MSFTMIGKPEVKVCTLALAKKFAEMEPVRGDRKIRPERAALIRQEIDAGTFRTCEWATYLCEADGIEYRANGKHTSNVLASMNGTFPKHLSVIIERFQGPDIATGAELYNTFDTKSASRSSSDINHAYAAANPLLDGISRRLISVCCGAIAYNTFEDRMSANTTAGQRARACISNAEFMIWLNGLCGGDTKESRHLMRGSSVAAAYRSWLKSKAAATEFWTLVKDGSGTNHRGPDRKVRDFLLSCAVAKGRGAKTGKISVAPREMFVKCIHAWNAWRKKESTDLKFYPKAKTPACV